MQACVDWAWVAFMPVWLPLLWQCSLSTCRQVFARPMLCLIHTCLHQTRHGPCEEQCFSDSVMPASDKTCCSQRLVCMWTGCIAKVERGIPAWMSPMPNPHMPAVGGTSLYPGWYDLSTLRKALANLRPRKSSNAVLPMAYYLQSHMRNGLCLMSARSGRSWITKIEVKP